MFWNDIQEIKEIVMHLSNRLQNIESNVVDIFNKVQEKSEKCWSTEEINECLIDLKDIFCSEDECSSINRIHDMLNLLVNDKDREHKIERSELILDKFADYMKNVDKLNGMINEFKGCVAMSRGILHNDKGIEDKINDIYYLVDDVAGYLQKQELEKQKVKKKKPATKRKVTKKKKKEEAVSAASLSQ